MKPVFCLFLFKDGRTSSGRLHGDRCLDQAAMWRQRYPLAGILLALDRGAFIWTAEREDAAEPPGPWGSDFIG